MFATGDILSRRGPGVTHDFAPAYEMLPIDDEAFAVGQISDLRRKTLKVSTAIFVCLLALGACAQPLPKPVIQSAKVVFKADIGIVNHTEHYIYSTSVNGVSGGHSHKMSAGIGNLCCVKLPMKWHPGLMVEVRWDMPEGIKHIYKSKIVEVEKYDEQGTLYVHFFPGDNVRVVVTNWVGASSKHPIAPPPGTMMPPLE